MIFEMFMKLIIYLNFKNKMMFPEHIIPINGNVKGMLFFSKNHIKLYKKI